MNQPRTITISPVLNGYRVEVGCQEVVFESRKRLLKKLGQYLKNPNKVEAEYSPADNAPPLEEYRNEGRYQFGEVLSSASVRNPVGVTVSSDSVTTEAETEAVAQLRQEAINYLRDTESHPGAQYDPLSLD